MSKFNRIFGRQETNWALPCSTCSFGHLKLNVTKYENKFEVIQNTVLGQNKLYLEFLVPKTIFISDFGSQHTTEWCK